MLRAIVTIYRLLMIIVSCIIAGLISFIFIVIFRRSIDWGHNHLRCIWSGLILTLCFVKHRAYGLSLLDKNQTYVFISNHKSEYDWYLFTHHIPFNWRAVIKAALRNHSFAGPMAARLDQIFLESKTRLKRMNKSGITDLIEKCHPHILKNRSILLYPEGSRTQSEVLDEFRLGSFALAIEYQIPIAVISVKETNKSTPGLFGRSFGHSPGKVNITVLKTIATKGLTQSDAEELRLHCQDLMRKALT